jgi:hypothetical protein
MPLAFAEKGLGHEQIAVANSTEACPRRKPSRGDSTAKLPHVRKAKILNGLSSFIAMFMFCALQNTHHAL